ncbi:MAG: ATP-binding protein [Syntrophobacteraceae bacterium]
MPSCLPINIDNLLHFRGVESTRVEFKASWDEATTGLQVLHTISAFANDFQNLNGGYIVIGVAQEQGQAVLPPKGLTPLEIEEAQHWVRGRCNTIDPVYQPIFSPEVVDGRHILVIWAPGSDVRPHQTYDKLDRGERRYYIRLGDETIDITRKPELLTQLMQLTARVPFDDRRAQQASILDVRETKVREFLQDIRSDLVNEQDTKTIYRCLRIAVPVNDHDVPKNVGLLFFSQDPEQWFPGARIEVVQFAADASGNVFEEKPFKQRPIHEQLRECLSYLENLSVRQVEKVPYRPEAAGWVSYPSQALREALVNAVYHRSYEPGAPEPVKVYLYPDRMEIISYPGPVPGIEKRHLEGLDPLPPVPARNRRIGEFLKELRLAEGRGTGLPKVRRSMQENGSPPPRFDFDEARSYFRVTLPAHPEYIAVLALQDAARLRAIGDSRAALERLRSTLSDSPSSAIVAAELVVTLVKVGDLEAACSVFEEFVIKNPGANASRLILPLVSAYLDAGRRSEALKLLDRIPEIAPEQDAIETAIQEKRAERLEKAHRYFTKAGDAVLRDVRALHEFAQTKMKLSGKARGQRGGRKMDRDVSKRLLREAREMLERVAQMEAPPMRRAWAYYDLGKVLKWSKAPISEVRRAFTEACRLQPEERRFIEALERLDSEG